MSERSARASILMYHRLSDAIVDRQEAIYTIRPSDFDDQMSLLTEKRVSVLPLEDVISGRFRDRAVALTFDDGCQSDFTVAFPRLRAHGFHATFFVNPARIGNGSFVTWKNIEQLAEAGMAIGSHGLDHRPLDGLHGSELERQLTESKAMLEERLRREIVMFALPGGKGGGSVTRLAHRVGYRTVLGSKPGCIARDGNPAILPRYAVRRGRGTVHFEGLVTQRSGARMEELFRYYALTMLRGAVGAGYYERLRMRLSARLMGNTTSEQP
jgi:peptidoglycan/xylan/chitin deacetylase (PgdA/CDA1 family)